MTTYLLDFLIGLQSSTVDRPGNGDGGDRACHDPSSDGLSLWCRHSVGSRNEYALSNDRLFADVLGVEEKVQAEELRPPRPRES